MCHICHISKEKLNISASFQKGNVPLLPHCKREMCYMCPTSEEKWGTSGAFEKKICST
jgi:hypothetical protein